MSYQQAGIIQAPHYNAMAGISSTAAISATAATGWSVTSSGYYHLLSTTHSNSTNYYAMQLSADFYTNNLYYRSTNGNGASAWNKVVIDNAATYNISISGSANTLSNAYAHTNGTDGWWRTAGNAGWYNETYTTGIFSTSASLVQTYNNSSFQVNGTLYAAGDVAAFYSDVRLKDRTGEIVGALDKVNKLSGFYYTVNALGKSYGFTDERVQVGVSAQEVEAVVPEAVQAAPFDISRDEGTTSQSISGENYKTVQYERLAPLLIEAITGLLAKIR
jgi:hypothetical protein